MAVERAFAEAGEVFAASENFGGGKAGEKFAGILSSFGGISGDGAGTQDAARGVEGEVENWSKVEVESEGAAVIADDPAVGTKAAWIAGGKDFRGRRCCAEDI